jgi:hypothetical protein
MLPNDVLICKIRMLISSKPGQFHVMVGPSSPLRLKKRYQVLGIKRLLGTPEDVIDLEILRGKSDQF